MTFCAKIQKVKRLFVCKQQKIKRLFVKTIKKAPITQIIEASNLLF